MFNLFKLFKKKNPFICNIEPIKMYKVEYDPEDDCYWGYRRTGYSRLAPFTKVRNTYSNSFDCSLERLKGIINRTENSQSIEF